MEADFNKLFDILVSNSYYLVIKAKDVSFGPPPKIFFSVVRATTGDVDTLVETIIE